MFDRLEQTFAKQVEGHVLKYETGYIDAVVAVCEELEIDPALAAKYITAPIKEKIRVEGEQTNLLPRTPKLF